MNDSLDSNYARGGFGHGLDLGARPVVVMVDPVRAYVDPASTLYAGVEDAVKGMAALVAAARIAGVPVLWTRVSYRADGLDGGVFWRKVPALAANFVEGNPLGDFIEGLEPLAGEQVLVKKYPSAFFGTPLAATLTAAGADTVVIAGLSTSGCVRATAVDAMQYGFVPVVVSDAVGDRHPEPHRANLFDLAVKCAEVMPVAAVQAYLARVSG